ncbi:putative transcription factor MYB-HB-like family [Helianthus annuus]|nr:putative transcription factor MYB-HB-like family [Helianthus annuus]KAJ0510771.1 putative transcription factor MYB-HB-like family [Helianthus annuus]
MAPKKWWTSKEEEALKAGVKEYKAGNWKDILKDPRFASILANRTNIDLKVFLFVFVTCKPLYIIDRESDPACFFLCDQICYS